MLQGSLKCGAAQGPRILWACSIHYTQFADQAYRAETGQSQRAGPKIFQGERALQTWNRNKNPTGRVLPILW